MPDSAWILLTCVSMSVTAALVWRVTKLAERLRAMPARIPPAPEVDAVQKRLAAVSREYDALLAYCGGGVLIIGVDDLIERANVTARYMLGVPTLDMIGKSVLQGTLSSELCELVEATRESRCILRREISAPGPAGCQLTVVASPVIEDDSDLCRIILVVQDVTELRRLETVRRDFVANVSHELRTPLTSIRAMAETLLDGAMRDASVAYHFLKTIIDETARLTRISEDLLHLSQAESHSPEMKRFNLVHLCEEVAVRLKVQAVKAGLQFECDLPARIEVTANHDQIEQVLVNLLDNAIKYTAAGGTVRLSAEQTSEAAIVRVSDTGIGIMASDIPRIFERFYRVDKARSRQSGGTGLGLSIVKHIVEAHGGTVQVDSEYNCGSTFIVTLPRDMSHGGLERRRAASRHCDTLLETNTN